MSGSGFSKYDRNERTQSVYCYPDSNVLKNKENIRDAKALSEYETDVTAVRQYMLVDKPIKGKFGIAHLKNIHKFIFQDIYPFAGKFRSEDIWKGDTFFCKSEYIEANLNALLLKLKNENYLQRLDFKEFTVRVSFYMAELNMVHPFREGNGRTIREFIRCLALESGFDVDWSLVDSKELLNAAIRSVDCDLQLLIRCLEKVVTLRDHPR